VNIAGTLVLENRRRVAAPPDPSRAPVLANPINIYAPSTLLADVTGARELKSGARWRALRRRGNWSWRR